MIQPHFETYFATPTALTELIEYDCGHDYVEYYIYHRFERKVDLQKCEIEFPAGLKYNSQILYR